MLTHACHWQGGVTRSTAEAVLLCEAAGYDCVLIETVGVGQSETAAASLVDCFVYLVAPFGGDELQGMKKGIMELADVIVVNKADGEQKRAASRVVASLLSTLALVRPKYTHWRTQALSLSAVERSVRDVSGGC